ncbi:Ig-like domain-containing protein [Pseudomonas frederiksbergensis]|uniref:Ig-like domain-containing protein n=1 Tax=Pseudomonas frederiksbergensis TaxID=104087 RepID=UPI000F4628C8|nr:Ig-like domain-containing protein [Pseudomonas frederiksbergensis]RON50121.1 hypothetical protein BK667_19050 [Pseudomonas frederiksbergensis]
MTAYSLFLFAPQTTETSPLALRPLQISSMTYPVVDGDGGINIAVVTQHPNGVLCVISAYLGMQAGDRHDIYWEGAKIFTREVYPDEVNQPLFFYLPTEPITPDWGECYYILTRNGQPVPDAPSISIRLRVKLDRPGGRDKNPHLPDGHSELNIVQLPEDVIRNGVHAEWAARGVPVTVPVYPNIALRDTVQVKWGSVLLAPHQITREQASGADPIVVTADQAAILAAGDSDALLVQYDIVDEVWNFAERWSQRTPVAVDAGAWRLRAPIIQQASGGVIDLEALGYDDVYVQILVEGAEFEQDDTLEMTCVGLTASGERLSHTESVQILSEPPLIAEVPAPNALFRALAGGSVEAAYTLIKYNGSPPLSSKRAFASVVGDVIELPAPTVREAQGDTLDPDAEMATVDVGYADMANGDLINLIGLGSRANGQPYPFEYQHTVSSNDAVEKRVTLSIETHHITALKDGSLDLFYRVMNDNVQAAGIYESRHQLLRIAAIPGEYPAPTVVEAPDGFLDPIAVPHSATVRVDNDQTQVGDEVTYYWKGPTASGTTQDSVPVTTLNRGKPIHFRVDARFITPNISELVAVRYSIKRGTPIRYLFSETLPLQVGRAIEPEIVSVTDSKGPIPLDGITFDSSVRLAGKAHPGRQVQTFDGATPLAVLDVSAEGDWNQTLALQQKTYRLTAKALYGSRPESAPHGLSAVETVTPRILSLTDSKGEILPDGISFDKVFTLKGVASPNQTVRILDGATTLAEPIVDASGDWTYTHTSPTVKAFSLTVSGLYGSEPVSSPPRNFTQAQAQEPVISSVTDTRGSVAPDGVTFFTSVNLEGTASPNQRVRIRDGSTSLGEPATDAAGTWRHPLNGLSVKAYSLTALALYGDGQVSTPRTFRVEAPVSPNIDSITDSKGPVLEGAITYDRTVTVKGTANANQKVRLLDFTATLGEPTANASGTWTLPVANLSAKPYRLTALALYGSGEVSNPARTFVVANAVEPSISSITDSKGASVGQDGITFDTVVNIVGQASPGQSIRLLDSATSWGQFPVDGTGTWRMTRSGLTVKSYSLTAMGLYGSEPVSTPPRRFQVKNPLSIVPTQMNLNGFSVKIAQWTKTGADSVNNTATRVATGGTPPYSYASSNPAVASVTNAGKVTGNRNGSATITVSDNAGARVSYVVAVTNVFELRISTTRMGSNESVAWMNSLRGQTTYNYSFLRDIALVYVRPTRTENIWMCAMSGPRWGIFLHPAYVVYGGTFITSPLFAWCLVPL